MIGLKRYTYRFLIGLLIFGLLPLSLSAQKTNDENVITFEIIRPPMDSVDNIKEYEFVIIRDKETNEWVVIVYDDDGNPVRRKLDDDELRELGFIEDVRDLNQDQIIGIERWPDGTLILSYVDDDGITVRQEITLDEAIALGLVESEDELDSDGLPVPDTATSIYNYLALGALLVVIGSGLYFIQRKGD